MKKVKLIGKLKRFEGKKIIVSTYEKEGWLKDGKIFYPDKENLRDFHKVVECRVCWDEGILLKEVKEIKEYSKKEIKEEKNNKRKNKKRIKDKVDGKVNENIEEEVKEEKKQVNEEEVNEDK